MPEKKKKSILDTLRDFGAGLLGGVIGLPGDIEYMIRNPRETVQGLLSFLDPHADPLGELLKADLSRQNVQPTGTLFPTSDEATAMLGGNPYSMAGLVGLTVGLPQMRGVKLAERLRGMTAADRLAEMGATQGTLDRFARVAKKEAGIGDLYFEPKRFLPEQRQLVEEAARRGSSWLWEGTPMSLSEDPEILKFHLPSVYVKRVEVPDITNVEKGKSKWYRGMDVGEAAKKAAENTEHIEPEVVGRKLGLQRPLTKEDLSNIRNGLINLLEYGERVVGAHSKEFYSEAQDVNAALAAGDPVLARKLAIIFGATSPQTSVESSIRRGYAIATDTPAMQQNPMAYAVSKTQNPVLNVDIAYNAAQKGMPLESPKVNAFTHLIDPTVGSLLDYGRVFPGTVNDSHMYQLFFWLANRLIEVGPDGIVRLDKKRYDAVRRAAAKDIMSPGDYKEFVEELKKNPNAVPRVNEVPTPLHKFMDGEMAFVSDYLKQMPPSRAQAVLWGLKQIVEDLSTKGAADPKDLLAIRNSFSNTYANAVARATGVVPMESMFGSNVSTLAATTERSTGFKPSAKAAIEKRLGPENYAQMLRDAGLLSPEYVGEPGLGVYTNPQGRVELNSVFPTAFNIPTEGVGNAARFYDEVAGPPIRTMGRLAGQNVVAPGWITTGPLEQRNALLVTSGKALSRQQLEKVRNTLVREGLPPDIVDRRGMGVVITDFNIFSNPSAFQEQYKLGKGKDIRALAKKVEEVVKKVTGEKEVVVEPVTYESRYEEVINTPVTGKGDVTSAILSEASQNVHAQGLLEGKGVGQYAKKMLKAYETLPKRYGLTTGLGPGFDFNTAYRNLYEILAKAKRGERAKALRQALESGVPLPLVGLLYQEDEK